MARSAPPTRSSFSAEAFKERVRKALAARPPRPEPGPEPPRRASLHVNFAIIEIAKLCNQIATNLGVKLPSSPDLGLDEPWCDIPYVVDMG